MATAFLEADDGATVIVAVEEVGKTESRNELPGRSVWLCPDRSRCSRASRGRSRPNAAATATTPRLAGSPSQPSR